MEYIDLIMRYIDLPIEHLRLITSEPWTPEFLLFTTGLGALLYIVSIELFTSDLWTSKKWGRRVGIILTTFGLGSLMIAFLFGMDVQFAFFTFPEKNSTTRSKTTANNYLKESWRESYKTKGALPEPLVGGNQQKPDRETLPPKDSSTSKWYEVRKWRGTGPKQTETFQIPSYLWMIEWNTLPTGRSPSFFAIKVYSAEGKFIGSAAKTKGEDIDSAVMNNSGDYYLVIETNQKYTVSVRANQRYDP